MINDPFQNFSTNEKEILELRDDRGREYSVEIITSFAIDDNQYLVAIPIDEADYDLINLESPDLNSDHGGFLIMRLGEDASGDETLEEVKDLNELDEIKEFLEESLAE
ncbi:DUF1292 domain-containing protein [Leptospira sp. GIMC2001]|uniref:DUF1292 domain-containing protein n=1 Tax=Leptospira sp. GIMC2001 TaxID=1513297 RepID=UPI00234A5767|nr:DUF1292 domain-containing protein [Leptospira sp. GIMC2001]WCL50236.1 DUF1292 domain-containing protein [Leptospira sp. GIMC2001]